MCKIILLVFKILSNIMHPAFFKQNAQFQTYLNQLIQNKVFLKVQFVYLIAQIAERMK